MTQVVTFVQGTRDFLLSRLTAILPGMNADLSAKVAGGFVPFTLVVGAVASASEPRLAVSWTSDTANRTTQNGKRVTVAFKVEALIPVAGNNTSSNFEVARQVSHDWVQTLLDDDDQMLNPYIDAGLINAASPGKAQPGVFAVRAERGDFLEIFPRMMEDRVTVVRGWKVPYSASFSLQTR